MVPGVLSYRHNVGAAASARSLWDERGGQSKNRAAKPRNLSIHPRISIMIDHRMASSVEP